MGLFMQKWSIATQKYWPLGLLIELWNEKGAKLSYWLHTSINFSFLHIDSHKAKHVFHCSFRLSVIRQFWSHLALCCWLLFFVLWLQKSQNSSYRIKRPSEIIKMILTLYSKIHVPWVLKMETRTHERYFKWQKQKWTLFADRYKPVQWQWKLFPQGYMKHSPLH